MKMSELDMLKNLLKKASIIYGGELIDEISEGEQEILQNAYSVIEDVINERLNNDIYK